MSCCNRLPLIPLSPYIQTSCEYAKLLAQTTKSLSEEENATIKSSLEKSLNKEREKLDRLTKSMQSIQLSCLLDFNIYDIAKEIAYINCSLFRMVTLDKNWLCNFDKQSNMVPLLDFHRYLSHSFAHQIIYGDPKKKSVIQLIHLAYILLHVYRDFSGCTAILTSLNIPEVRRLQTMWAPCPPKLIHVYQDLVAMLSPENNYEAYHHQLWLHTNRFLNITPSKSQMIAIPFMHAHLAIIQNLVQTHASVQAIDVVLSSAGQPLLTSTVHLLEFCQQFSKIDPSELEKFSSGPTAATINRRLSFQSSTSSSNANRRSSTSASKAIKLSTSTCLDLDLLRSDANIYHWIVSRAYLTRSQLHYESLHVEPLAVGEIELESEEEYDMYWDFFNKDFMMKEATTTVLKKDPPVKPSRSLKITNVNKQDPVQETVDGLNVVDSSKQPDQTSVPLSPVAKKEDVDVSNSEDQIQEESVKEDTNNVNVAITEEMSISNSETEPIKEDVVIDTADKEATHSIVEEAQNESNPSISQKPELDVEQQSQYQLIEENQVQPNEEASAVKVQEKEEPANTEDVQNKEVKPILSPKAPEIIPCQSADDTKQNEAVQESDEDNIMVLTEEDDEEWTGYPHDSTPSQTVADTEEEEEEWTGYPVTSQDEDDDDEEEVWKGYPIPNEEEHQQYHEQQQNNQDDDYNDDDEARKSPVEVSSPSTPSEEEQELMHHHEEWKGYQKTIQEEEEGVEGQETITAEEDTDTVMTAENSASRDPLITSYNNMNANTINNKNHHHQLHAIGKAAARRMQYSLSSTDINRKRLPSPFAPSSST